MVWDSSILAERELQERCSTGMPPAVSVACVWGRDDAVRTALEHIGVIGGDMELCPAPQGSRHGFDQVLVPLPLGSGGDERDRTDDPLLAKQVLSQLSYTPVLELHLKN